MPRTKPYKQKHHITTLVETPKALEIISHQLWEITMLLEELMKGKANDCCHSTGELPMPQKNQD